MDLLQNWAVLNTHLTKLSEKECAELLKREKKGKKRFNFLLRIYGRYNRLRTVRERAELMRGK